MIMGAERDYETNESAGAANIYAHDGSNWNFHTKLLASDGNAEDRFGHDVDVQGNRAVVGAPHDSDQLNNAGSAYIYEWNGSTWSETKITASNLALDAKFGNRVAIYGDRVVVGSMVSEVYVFELISGSWIQTEILIGSNSGTDDLFGLGLDIHEDRISIGARYNDAIANNAGSAYVFDYNGTGWVETIVNGSGIGVNNLYGWSLALDKDRMVVGAPGFLGGSAYVFDYDGTSWNETDIVTASDGIVGDSYGRSVGLSQDRFIIGAAEDNDFGSDTGSAYFYDLVNNTWEETKVLASDAASSNYFGQSVDIFKDTAVVGIDSDHGRAYIFHCSCEEGTEPVALCQDINLALDFNSSAGILAEDLDMGSYDECEIQSMTLSQENFNCSHIGTNPVILTITDSANNTSTCSSTVIIEDPLNSCNPCSIPLLNINTSDITGDDMLFNDAEVIESSAQISHNNILFTAKTTIELEANFEVLTGKTFTVEIGPCP